MTQEQQNARTEAQNAVKRQSGILEELRAMRRQIDREIADAEAAHRQAVTALDTLERRYVRDAVLPLPQRAGQAVTA